MNMTDHNTLATQNRKPSWAAPSGQTYMKAFAFTLTIITFAALCTSGSRPPGIVQASEDPLPTAPATLGPGETPPTTAGLTPVIKPSVTLIPTSSPQASDEARWSIYHPDPQHLWNRLFRRFFRRTTSDAQEYGWDSLDPLLWPETTYLLDGTSYQQAVQLLDEFLTANGEELIAAPLKRALFQRDLWAVFDWLGLRSDSYIEQRKALQGRIARIIQQIALKQEEILLLPDNYEAAVSSGIFAASFQNENPRVAFLPADLLEPDGEWVCVGREGGPIAMTHTEDFPFLGRSVFLVFMKIPGSREATLDCLQRLSAGGPPALPNGLEVALVRRAILIDQQGDMVLSPIVESIQIRHFRPTQFFYNFGLSRNLLFAEAAGGLQPLEKEIMLFRSHGDGFISGHLDEVDIPDICIACHIDVGLGIGGITSILSYSRARFPLANGQQSILTATALKREAETVISWKVQQKSWQALQMLWHTGEP